MNAHNFCASSHRQMLSREMAVWRAKLARQKKAIQALRRFLAEQLMNLQVEEPAWLAMSKEKWSPKQQQEQQQQQARPFGSKSSIDGVVSGSSWSNISGAASGSGRAGGSASGTGGQIARRVDNNDDDDDTAAQKWTTSIPGRRKEKRRKLDSSSTSV